MIEFLTAVTMFVVWGIVSLYRYGLKTEQRRAGEVTTWIGLLQLVSIGTLLIGLAVLLLEMVSMAV